MILLNGQKLDFTTFPNGETKVDAKQLLSLSKDKGINHVVLKYENDGDLTKLMFVKRFLESTEARKTHIALSIMYMPYSRMDRVEGLSVFTLKYISEFINSLMFDEIIVYEPHSDVTMALLDNATALYPTVDLLSEVLNEVRFDKETDYLFFPDAGAQKRYHSLTGFKSAVGYKQRDFQTGKIKGLQVIGDLEDISGKKVIIVDDLCSYGGTFYGVDDEGNAYGCAAELKKLGAKEIYLFVTHAEYAILEGKILYPDSPIDKVFTTNTIIKEYIGESSVFAKNKLVVYDILDGML